MLLQGVGVDAALLVSEQFAHAAIGVAWPGEGMRVQANGRSYLFWEVTSPGWQPGRIKPEMNKPQFWRVVSLQPEQARRKKR